MYIGALHKKSSRKNMPVSDHSKKANALQHSLLQVISESIRNRASYW